jgi:hypothetical protein
LKRKRAMCLGKAKRDVPAERLYRLKRGQRFASTVRPFIVRVAQPKLEYAIALEPVPHGCSTGRTVVKIGDNGLDNQVMGNKFIEGLAMKQPLPTAKVDKGCFVRRRSQ